MNRISFKSSWLLLIIPLGIITFIVFPQLKNTYNTFHKKEVEHQLNVKKLDSLKQLDTPTRSDEREISRLEIIVPTHGKLIQRERYNNYKIGGMLIVLIFMFLGMFGSSYWVRRKKSSSSNKQVTFNFADPSFDAIGQHISWEATQGSGSNFLSEHLKKTRTGYKIASSTYMKFIAWSFFLIGANQLFWTYMYYVNNSETSLGFMKIGELFFTSGGIFMIVGAFLLVLTGSKAVIHTRKRKLIVGGKILNYNQLYALQVLEKLIQGSSSSGSYFCYEVNLITKEGERYNLLNHGDKVFLLSDMAKLSKILNLQVWNRGVV